MENGGFPCVAKFCEAVQGVEGFVICGWETAFGFGVSSVTFAGGRRGGGSVRVGGLRGEDRESGHEDGVSEFVDEGNG